MYVAAEILYERFKPMVEEQLASSPFAKVAFTVSLLSLHLQSNQSFKLCGTACVLCKQNSSGCLPDLLLIFCASQNATGLFAAALDLCDSVLDV